MSVRTSTQNVLLARPRLFFKDGSPSTKAIIEKSCYKSVSASANSSNRLFIAAAVRSYRIQRTEYARFHPIGVLISSALNHKS